MLNFSAADDVFVREDLLKTKYNFVDFAAAEEYHNWCPHYSHCSKLQYLAQYQKSEDLNFFNAIQ